MSNNGGRSVGISLCVFFVLIIATIITLLALNSVYGKPKLYIQDLYIPALNNSTQIIQSSLNTSIFINLKFRRPIALYRIRFDDFNVTLFYGFNRSFPVAATAVRGFNLGYKRRAGKKVAVEAAALPWEEALRGVFGGSAVALVVELVLKPMYEHCDYDSPHRCSWSEGKAAAVAADVWVDGSGEMVSKKPIRLR